MKNIYKDQPETFSQRVSLSTNQSGLSSFANCFKDNNFIISNTDFKMLNGRKFEPQSPNAESSKTTKWKADFSKLTSPQKNDSYKAIINSLQSPRLTEVKTNNSFNFIRPNTTLPTTTLAENNKPELFKANRNQPKSSE